MAGVAQRKARERDRKRAQGLVRVHYPETWLRPEQVEAHKDDVKQLAAELNKET
ncbi:unnamed protein product [marine sediment metagenome]|uniref:Uncharacterized protein n=1 Tax=marine sediment metagenome TaxID=412755 RepID=X0VRQ1_9ZZZZ